MGEHSAPLLPSSKELLTVEEGECFETGESTDGESEELDDLIYRAENSQHLWLTSETDEALNDVDFLHKKLKQKDEGLNLTAKIGKKLLLSTNNLTHQNERLQNEIQDLRDELNQLKYSQTPRGRSFQLCEECDVTGDDNEDEDIDEGTSCTNQSIMFNCNLINSNMNHNITTISSSLEETLTLRRQIEQLNNNNNLLRDEVKMLQQQSQEDFQRLKDCYGNEFGQAKKLINNLEKRIESGETRFGKFEQEALVWKHSVEALANKCNQHETEIDCLQGEICKIKTIQKEDRKAMQQLLKENHELHELVDSLKDRVHQMERTKQPKVLRHVTDSKSPYVDSMSFAQELEKSSSAENKNSFLLDHQMNGLLCRSTPNIHQISNLRPTSNIFFKLKRMLGLNRLKLGQPGRPGSNDLDHAVNHLKAIEPSRSFIRRRNKSHKLISKESATLSPNISNHYLSNDNGDEIDDSMVLDQINALDVTQRPLHLPLNRHHQLMHNIVDDGLNSFNNDVTSSRGTSFIHPFSPSPTYKLDSGYSSTPQSSNNKAGLQNFSILKSRLLQEWMTLGTPDLTKILRKQSGVWVKGSNFNDVFIEENFATIFNEVENDDNDPTCNDVVVGRGNLNGGDVVVGRGNLNGGDVVVGRGNLDGGDGVVRHSGLNMRLESNVNDINKFKFIGINDGDRVDDSCGLNLNKLYSQNDCAASTNTTPSLHHTTTPQNSNNNLISYQSTRGHVIIDNNNIKKNGKLLDNVYGSTNCLNTSSSNIINKISFNSCLNLLKQRTSSDKSSYAADVGTPVCNQDDHPNNGTSVENVTHILPFQNKKLFFNNRSISLNDISNSLSKSLTSLLHNNISNNLTYSHLNYNENNNTTNNHNNSSTADLQMFDFSDQQLNSPPLSFSKRVSETS